MIKRADMLEALAVVRPGLTSVNENVKDDRVFMFDAGSVVTFNSTLLVRRLVKGIDFTGSIQAAEFYALIDKLAGDELNVELLGGEVLLTSGRVKAGFALQQDSKLPDAAVEDHGKWKALPEVFDAALAFTMTTCASMMSRPELTCVHVRSDGRLESSDNYRVSVYDVGAFGVRSFLLPATSAAALSRHKLVKVAEGENWMHFKTDKGTRFGCRVFGEEFPSLDALLDVRGVVVDFPHSIQEMLDRAISFCAQQTMLDRRAVISIEKKMVKLRVEIDTAWFEEKKRIAYEGEPIEFVINPHLMKYIIGQTQTCTVSENCLKFAGERWQHIVALVGKGD